jgi:hypothetical protein
MFLNASDEQPSESLDRVNTDDVDTSRVSHSFQAVDVSSDDGDESVEVSAI